MFDRSEYMKEYNKKNKDKIKAYQKARNKKASAVLKEAKIVSAKIVKGPIKTPKKGKTVMPEGTPLLEKLESDSAVKLDFDSAGCASFTDEAGEKISLDILE